MQIPLQVTFEGCEPLETVSAVIEREAARLATHNHDIIGCRVVVVAPSDRQHHGAGYQIRIWVTAPPHENIIVNRIPSDDARLEHVEVAVKEAFSAARRQIDDRVTQGRA